MDDPSATSPKATDFDMNLGGPNPQDDHQIGPLPAASPKTADFDMDLDGLNAQGDHQIGPLPAVDPSSEAYLEKLRSLQEPVQLARHVIALGDKAVSFVESTDPMPTAEGVAAIAEAMSVAMLRIAALANPQTMVLRPSTHVQESVDRMLRILLMPAFAHLIARDRFTGLLTWTREEQTRIQEWARESWGIQAHWDMDAMDYWAPSLFFYDRNPQCHSPLARSLAAIETVLADLDPSQPSSGIINSWLMPAAPPPWSLPGPQVAYVRPGPIDLLGSRVQELQELVSARHLARDTAANPARAASVPAIAVPASIATPSLTAHQATTGGPAAPIPKTSAKKSTQRKSRKRNTGRRASKGTLRYPPQPPNATSAQLRRPRHGLRECVEGDTTSWDSHHAYGPNEEGIMWYRSDSIWYKVLAYSYRKRTGRCKLCIEHDLAHCIFQCKEEANEPTALYYSDTRCIECATSKRGCDWPNSGPADIRDYLMPAVRVPGMGFERDTSVEKSDNDDAPASRAPTPEPSEAPSSPAFPLARSLRKRPASPSRESSLVSKRHHSTSASMPPSVASALHSRTTSFSGSPMMSHARLIHTQPPPPSSSDISGVSAPPPAVAPVSEEEFREFLEDMRDYEHVMRAVEEAYATEDSLAGRVQELQGRMLLLQDELLQAGRAIKAHAAARNVQTKALHARYGHHGTLRWLLQTRTSGGRNAFREAVEVVTGLCKLPDSFDLLFLEDRVADPDASLAHEGGSTGEAETSADGKGKGRAR